MKEKEVEKKGQTPNMIFINRIKMENDGTASINYKVSNEVNAKEVSFRGKEQVTTEFSKLFQETTDGFTSIVTKLHPDINKLTMNVIKFDYGKSDFLEKALYSVKYAFSEQNNAVINISTPMLPIYKEEFGDKTFCLSGRYVDQLYEVIEAAKRYINGETKVKQQDLGLTIVK